MKTNLFLVLLRNIGKKHLIKNKPYKCQMHHLFSACVSTELITDTKKSTQRHCFFTVAHIDFLITTLWLIVVLCFCFVPICLLLNR